MQLTPEYDNDIDDPYKEYVDHRRSAVFRQFQQQRRAPTLPPLQVKGQGFAGIGAGKGTPTPLSPSGRPLPLPPGPPSAGVRSNLSFSGGDMPPDIPADVNVDLDDWDLPKHMVSEGPVSSPVQADNRQPASPGYMNQPTSPGEFYPNQPTSPGSYLPNQPTSPGSYFPPVAGAPDYPPPSPAYSTGRVMDAGAIAQEHGASARPGHGRTISQMSNPIPQRPRSVQIETVGDDERQEFMDELSGRHSLDAYGAEADAALRDANAGRVRRSVESGSNRRNSTIASLALEDNWDGTRRPDPIMVPLPDSPTSDRWADSAIMRRPAPKTAPPRRSVVMDERDILDNAFEMNSLLPELEGRFTPGSGDPQRLSLDLTQMDSRSDGGSGRFDRRPSLVYLDPGRPTSVSSMDHPASFYGGGSEVDISSPTRPVFDDIPTAEEYGRPLRPPKYGNQAYRMARQQLLRPKTLIMPSTLEGTERPTATVHIPEGFTLGEKPLPEEARASILNQGKGVPLSLAQKTFRSSLMVGGTRENEFFQGQADEGEALPGISEEERLQAEQERRQPGKLFGTSLIDQLEARKNQQASRKRVFYGDNRPSMMARSMHTKSTLLDPNALDPPTGEPDARPKSYAPVGGDRPISYAPGDPRPKSYAPGVPTTINFPDEDHEDGDIGNAATTARQTNMNARQANARSVFGVDTVWEREMAKLKEIEAAQANARAQAEAAERAKEDAKQAKLDARQSKMIDKAHNRKSFFGGVSSGNSRKSMLNPEFVPDNDPNFVRPMSIAFGPGGVIIPTGDDEGDEGDDGDEEDEREREREASPRTSRLSDRPPTLVLEAEGSDLSGVVPQPRGPPPPRRPGSRLGVETWFADSDEESDDNTPLSKGKGKANVLPPALPSMRASPDSDSEDEVPLSRLKVVDSDEEVPLSQLRKKESVGTPTTATTATARPGPLPTIRPVGGPLTLDLPSFPASPTSPISPGISGGGTGGEGEEDDDEPLFVRKARQRSQAPEKTAEEIEDDLPLGWKHAGAAGGGRAQSSFMPSPSLYGQPGYPQQYGSPYGVQSAYGMPGMGMGGMGGPMMGGMMPGMGPMSPMAPPPMMGGGMMMPYPQAQGFEQPNPGSNIDKWRQGVAPGVGSAAGSVAPSVAPSQAGH